MKKWVAALAAVLAIAGGVFYLEGDIGNPEALTTGASDQTVPAEASIYEETAPPLPKSKIITGLAHEGQTFNNCSSVGLLIALSHWGIKDSQKDIAEATRPWNNAKGDNDDKSVTLYELAAYARSKHGLIAYVRPNGDIELLKKFIANDIPVVARALMYPKDDIAHYRVVHGYDDEKGIIIQTDSIEGRDKTYTYENWMHMWKDFNYSYLIVVPPEKKALVESILGEEASERVAWQNAKERAERALAADPNDKFARYNLLTANYYLGDYAGAVREFEKVEGDISRRALWYQMEPIDAYFQLGNYERVISLADSVINAENKAVSELYVLKGRIYQSRGELEAARAEYEEAILYNKHLQSAQDALASLGE